MKITRTKDDLMAELIETKRELANVKRDLDMTIEQRDKLSYQARNLTAEKSLWESRSGNDRRIIEELRRQRAEIRQALGRVLADSLAHPDIVSARPEKDEAPF